MKKMLYLVIAGSMLCTNAIDYQKNDASIDIADDKDTLSALTEYFNAFPQADYAVFSVTNLGQFYLDAIEDMIKKEIKKGKAWDGFLTRYYRKLIKRDSVAIDCGAHIGTQTISMARLVGSRGTVWSFEPQKRLFRELAMNIILNNLKNVRIRNVALGNSHGKAQLNHVDNTNQGGTSIGSGGEEVEMRTLDSFNLTNVSLIKIDVEGFEDNLLKGAIDTIKQNKPAIIIEIMGGVNREEAPQHLKERILATIKLLNEMDYQVLQIIGHDYLALPNDREIAPEDDKYLLLPKTLQLLERL